MRHYVLVAGALLAALGWTGSARADEAKTPINALMLLNVMGRPVESRDDAYNRALKDEGPSPFRSVLVPQADGSLRYEDGRTGVSITVKNPCPPGTAHYEPPPLPGRRARN
jgi:hypothetical protein